MRLVLIALALLLFGCGSGLDEMPPIKPEPDIPPMHPCKPPNDQSCK